MVTTTSIVNRPDEWKIEQGLSGAKLPFLDQTGSETVEIEPHRWGDLIKDESAIKAIGDRSKLFARELEGWKGFVVIYVLFLFTGRICVQLTCCQICGMGEVSREEGKGSQDTHIADLSSESRIPAWTNPWHQSCTSWHSLEDVASRRWG